MRPVACSCGLMDVTHSDIAFYEGPYAMVHGEHHCFFYPHHREAKIAVDD